MRLNIATRSGRVRVEGREGAGLGVQGGNVEHDDGTVRITAGIGGSNAVEVVCPAGSDVIVGTASGSVELVGSLGDVRVTTASGRIAIDDAQRVDVRTASGKIEIGRCRGECRVVTKSSRVRVGNAGTLDCSAVSGRIEVGGVDDANVRTVSGRVEMGTTSQGRVEVRSVSGKVDLAVPRDRRPATRLSSISGRVRCECASGDDGEIDVATTSGTINVTCK
jgi:DUF4097 and DUF4098 domain-containing protein YvlB